MTYVSPAIKLQKHGVSKERHTSVVWYVWCVSDIKVVLEWHWSGMGVVCFGILSFFVDHFTKVPPVTHHR